MVLKIGHRGAAGHAPENTLKSFMAAIGLGCDMIELDVHLCASGEVMVIHDDTVDRTTNGSGQVSELSLDELKRLDAGAGEQVPTLVEVLDLLKDRVLLNIELKGLGIAEPVYRILTLKGWRNEDFMVSSFNWGMLREYRDLNLNARLGVLSFNNHEEALAYAQIIDADSINLYHKLLSQEYVDEVHRNGFKIYPWTLNNAEDIKNAINLGVDGIISDYPDRITF